MTTLKNALACAALAALTTPAFAGDHVTRVAHGFVLNYSDLDIASVDGQERLASRIDTAISMTCRTQGVRSLADIRACERGLRQEVDETANAEVRSALADVERRHASNVRLSQN